MENVKLLLLSNIFQLCVPGFYRVIDLRPGGPRHLSLNYRIPTLARTIFPNLYPLLARLLTLLHLRHTLQLGITSFSKSLLAPLLVPAALDGEVLEFKID